MINRFLLILSLVMCVFVLHAQMPAEDCVNSLDDDGDGLIDLNDPDCKCKGIKDSFFVPSSLIPNPSFEDYNCCPSGLAQLVCSKNWIQASSATSDYYHTCGFKEDPNQRGYPPLPLPAGNGYVGFLDLKDYPGQPNRTYKEYVGACLTNTMYPGREYTLTFWIGFGRPGGVWGPRAITSLGIFGTSNCSNLPFGNGGWLCPTSYPGWFLLTSVTASGTNKWVKVKVKLRPTRTINAIVIGPACPRSDGYYYYWMDDLVLEETAKFDSIYLGIQGNPCVDSIRLSSPPTNIQKITYQWYYNGVAIPGATSQNYFIPKGQQGKYVLKAIDGNDCELSNTYNYNVDSISTDITQQICNGEIFKVGDYEFNAEGKYRVIIPSVDGCDSIVHLDLKVSTPGQGLIDTAVCESQTFEIDGIVYDSTGQYQIFNSTEFGCDSLTILNLRIIKTIRNQIDVAICKGEAYVVGQDSLRDPGVYPFNYTSSENCDSVVFINLYVNEHVSGVIDTVICLGESVTAGGITYDKTGSYPLFLVKYDGCDSIMTLNLKVTPVYFSLIDTSFCEGNQMTVGNQVFDKSGEYTFKLLTSHGCDSNFQLKLNVLPKHQQSFIKEICEGEKYNFSGSDYDKTGIYNVNLLNRFGCDSILELDLKVNPVYDHYLDTAICDNKNVRIGAVTYSQPGTYIQTYSSAAHCDSILHINLSAHKSYAQNIDTAICQGVAMHIGTQTFDKTGTYNIGLKTVEGCDSSIALNLNIKPAYKFVIDTVICFGSQIVIDGKTYTDETDFNLKYISAGGCDSIIAVSIKKTRLPDIQLEKKDILCFGDRNGSISVKLNGSDGPYTYNWNNGQTIPDLNQLAAGNYIVSIRDNQNCLIEKTVVIETPDQLKLQIYKKDASCIDPLNGSISIKAQSGGVLPYSYYINGRKVSFQNLTEIAETGQHEVMIVDANGCIIRQQVDIEEAQRGVIDLYPDSLSVILGDSVWMEVFVRDIDSIAKIEWIGPGSMSCRNCLRTSAFISSFKSNYKVVIVDNNGCVYEELVYVSSKQNYYAPNVFSPNGDNINDFFNLITDRSIDNIEVLQIFDRWGNQLYESKNFAPNGIDGAWNGEVNGQKAMLGVYVFLFLFKDKAGINHKLSGDLTLIR